MTPENFKVGVETLVEWFGAGMKPVGAVEANSRAQICAACPHNQNVKYSVRWGVYAETIKGVLGWVRGQNLRTTFDSKLGVCESCDCPMKVKVWVPKDVILSHMPESSKQKLWEKCWLQ